MTISGNVDLSGLLDAAGGDREIAASLIHLYFELTGGEIVQLKEAVREGNAKRVSAIAHKCAGSSISCGMTSLAALLKALETDSAQNMPADADQRLEEVCNELSAVQTALETHFNCSFAS